MSENIAANTLFHFTSSLKNLHSILKDGLGVRYSLENFESIIDGKSEITFPMTCFCDIPLSSIRNHTKNYGKYAVGLTKDWGVKHGVSPVIYAYPNSNTSAILNGITDDLSSFFDLSEEEKKALDVLDIEVLSMLEGKNSKRPREYVKKIKELNNRLKYLIKYIKPYSGKMYRGDQYIDVNFYEEREWRFLPNQELMEKYTIKDSYAAEYYKEPIKRRAINMKLAPHIKLNFHPSDIRFIIVAKDSEIPKCLKEINEIFHKDKGVSNYDLQLLGTRLISLEQILQDI